MEGASTPEQTPRPEQKGRSLEQLLITPDKRLTNFGLWATTFADATHNLDPKAMIQETSQKVSAAEQLLRKAIVETKGPRSKDQSEKKYWTLNSSDIYNLANKGKEDKNNSSFYLSAAQAAFHAASLIEEMVSKLPQGSQPEKNPGPEAVSNFCFRFGALATFTKNEALMTHPRADNLQFIENNLRGLLDNPEQTVSNLEEKGRFLTGTPESDVKRKQVIDDALAAALLENGYQYCKSYVSDFFDKAHVYVDSPIIAFAYEDKLFELFQGQIGSQNFGESFGTNNVSAKREFIRSVTGLLDKVRKQVLVAEQPGGQTVAQQEIIPESPFESPPPSQSSPIERPSYPPLTTSERFGNLSAQPIPENFNPKSVKELLTREVLEEVLEWKNTDFKELRKLGQSNGKDIGIYSKITLVENNKGTQSASKRLKTESIEDVLRGWKEAYLLALFQGRVPEIVRLHEIYYERGPMGIMKPVILMEPLTEEKGWFSLRKSVDKYGSSAYFRKAICVKLVNAIQKIEEVYGWEYEDFKEDCVFVRETPSGEPEIQIVDFTNVKPPTNPEHKIINGKGYKEIKRLWESMSLGSSEFDKEWRAARTANAQKEN